MAWYSAISVNQRRNAAWSAGSVRRRKSGVPSPKRSVRRSGDRAAATFREAGPDAAAWSARPGMPDTMAGQSGEAKQDHSTASAASGVSITLRLDWRVRALGAVTEAGRMCSQDAFKKVAIILARQASRAGGKLNHCFKSEKSGWSSLVRSQWDRNSTAMEALKARP